jgi:hydroxymethylbilane synthase
MAENNNTIGTDSELALWHTVEKELNDLGYKTEIVAVNPLETSS